jgi:pimeloyl-ACP methyl ester carboxylesterase
MPRLVCLCFVFIALSVPAAAQEVRFELGQRLRLFERALDRHPQAEARRRALEPLMQATPTFFQGRLADAAGLLDRARLLLAGEADDANLWAESLVCRPAKRLLDPTEKQLTCKIENFYTVKSPQPDRVNLRLSLLLADKQLATVRADLEKLPVEVRLPVKGLAEGDYLLRSEVLIAGKPAAVSEQQVSLVNNLSARLNALREGQASLPEARPTTERATLSRLVGILSDLADGRTQETNYPAARLVAEAEQLLKAIQAGQRYYTPDKAGQFWLTVAEEQSSFPVRLQVPAEAAKGKALPLVVAMHGAGGSENMFFDGYGDGLVAKLAAKRGWFLVTTRSPLFAFGGGVDVPRLVDSLAKRYPVDTSKVFLVGHSMGAAQAVATAGRQPERFRAVAALGGGGGFKASEAIRDLPFFVGIGERDFALNGARNLHAGLVKAGVKKAVLKRYPDVEHLTIVQIALPEVYAFFDETLKK